MESEKWDALRIFSPILSETYRQIHKLIYFCQKNIQTLNCKQLSQREMFWHTQKAAKSFSVGLCPRTHWGSLRCSPRPVSRLRRANPHSPPRHLCHLDRLKLDDFGVSYSYSRRLVLGAFGTSTTHTCQTPFISLVMGLQSALRIVTKYPNQWNNKFAQSNLGREPCHGTVAHVCRKVPVGYNCAPQICPHKYPFPWTDLQTPLPASSLDPSDLWC